MCVVSLMGILSSNFIYDIFMGVCVEPRNVERDPREREKFFKRERLQDTCDVEVEGWTARGGKFQVGRAYGWGRSTKANDV